MVWRKRRIERREKHSMMSIPPKYYRALAFALIFLWGAIWILAVAFFVVILWEM
jgi:hypothetical protein